MRKIALTSLLAVVATGAAHAANRIDGNPLYMPQKGHFYSETGLSSHTENAEDWALGEEFGYGLTNNIAVNVKTSVSEQGSFDHASWDDMSFGLTARLFDMGAWKADVYGGYGVAPIWGDHQPFLDEDYTKYTWTIGVRGGYQTGRFTLAGHVDFNYTGGESFNWDEEGMHVWKAGADAQLVINGHWNLVAGAEYMGISDEGVKDAGTWTGMFGVNYNIDPTKFIGLYISDTASHKTGDWKIDDGIGFGVKFGIEF